ncbi:beta-aspartyl-peptidase [Clostridium sp.]|uniref:beta-aspartyl-peptidase n=1 Tax=Clostridium sp. TaxID=1506 RepID=UPI002FCBF74D
MLTLIKNGIVYSPDYIGKKDILICGEKIGYIDNEIHISNINVPVEIIDAEDKLIFPGFIDSHVHILGGGGEGGFKTRTPEVTLSTLTLSGVTTVVGCLGTDGVARDMKSLIAKAKALKEEGISCYLYTGSYEVPVKTLMNNIREDIMLIEEIIGVGEVAISDHRSSAPTISELSKAAADARVAGMLSGKCGIVNIHVGDGEDKLDMLNEIIETTEIPMSQFVPTHINRNKSLFEEGIRYAKKGGLVDFTTSSTPQFLEDGEVKCSKGLKIMLENGVNEEKITFTSDGQGSLPLFEGGGKFSKLEVGTSHSLYKEVKDAIKIEGIPIEKAIKVITSNPAENLKLYHKGKIEVEKDADFVIVEKNSLEIETVIAKGKIMVNNKEAVIKGTFEK